MGGWALLSPANWPGFVLISARLTGLMLLAPIWSMVALPRSVRGAAVVVFAALLVPSVAPATVPAEVVELPLPLLVEFTLGVGIGLAAAVVSQAMLLASEVVSLQSGLSLGQVLSPNLETGGPALSQLYNLVGLATFVAVGGPTLMIAALARSLSQIPPGLAIGFDGAGLSLLDLTGKVFGFGIQIAAPVMVALTVTNVAMAILSRAVPQLNAMAMSFAVTLGVGLVMLGLSVPPLVRVASRWIADAPGVTDRLLDALTAAGAR